MCAVVKSRASNRRTRQDEGALIVFITYLFSWRGGFWTLEVGTAFFFSFRGTKKLVLFSQLFVISVVGGNIGPAVFLSTTTKTKNERVVFGNVFFFQPRDEIDKKRHGVHSLIPSCLLRTFVEKG